MERSLIERARAGDRDAFEALVQRKVDAVYRTSLAILGNPADAKDATQDAFVSMWRSFRGLREVDRFDAWFGRIVTNACRMTLRRRRSVREVAMPGSVAETQAAAADDSGELMSTDRFNRAFDSLAVEQRALLTAHHLDGRPIESLAAELGVPIGTAKSRLFTARRALGRALDHDR